MDVGTWFELTERSIVKSVILDYSTNLASLDQPIQAAIYVGDSQNIIENQLCFEGDLNTGVFVCE